MGSNLIQLFVNFHACKYKANGSSERPKGPTVFHTQIRIGLHADVNPYIALIMSAEQMIPRRCQIRGRERLLYVLSWEWSWTPDQPLRILGLA